MWVSNGGKKDRTLWDGGWAKAERGVLGRGVRTRGDRAPGSVDASLSVPVCGGRGGI